METLTESLVSFVLWGGLLFGSKNGVECIFFKPKGYYLLFTLKKMEAMHRASLLQRNSRQQQEIPKMEVSCKLKNKQNTKMEKEVIAKKFMSILHHSSRKFLEGRDHIEV